MCGHGLVGFRTEKLARAGAYLWAFDVKRESDVNVFHAVVVIGFRACMCYAQHCKLGETELLLYCSGIGV